MPSHTRIAILAAGLLLAAGIMHAQAPTSAAPAEVPSRTATAPSVPPRVVVLPVNAGAALRSVDGGVREWWMAELEANGVALVPRREANAAISAVAGPEQRTLYGDDTLAVAKHASATHVFTTELRSSRGETEVWMRVYAGGKPVAVGHAKGKLAKLGDLLGEASLPLRTALRLPGEPERARLGEFGVFERAGAALDEARPADAVPLLAGAHGHAAESLRAALADALEDPAVPLAERSRLASATGSNDPGWLQVRQGIIEGKDVELLLAGAANAESRGEHARAL